MQTEIFFKEKTDRISHFLTSHFSGLNLPESPESKKIIESVLYSIQLPAKRFRPLLALLLAESYGYPDNKILPWAAAVEMVHTYSLIHDDLPCMDNDDFRRGKASNHKVYGESMALLAGDALLTESFSILSRYYESEPQILVGLVRILSNASGLSGMVLGQVMDMETDKRKFSFDEILKMHRLKTGQMIQAPLQGAGLICGLPEESLEIIRKFGEALGLAFQVADDLLDINENTQEGRSLTKMIGLRECKSLLVELSDEALFNLNKLDIHTDYLHKMIEYNLTRHQ